MNNTTLIKEIIQLRLKGLGVKTISKKLNVSVDKVRYHCKKNNLNGVRSDNALKGTPFERFIFGFNNNHGDMFEYVSGFINSEKPVLVKCKSCEFEFTRSAQIARKKKKLTCKKCVENRKQVSNMKESLQKELNKQMTSIQSKANEYAKVLKLDINNIPKEFTCSECDKIFYSKRKKMYCSDKCFNHKNNRVKELRRRTKLKDNGDIDYTISLDKLINREKGRCALCGGKVDRNNYIITDEGYHISGDKYPSIDHILPVAKGGTHTWDNVQLAHRGCNTIKSDNEVYESKGQLVLSI